MTLEHGLVGAEPDVGVTRPSRVLVREALLSLDPMNAEEAGHAS